VINARTDSYVRRIGTAAEQLANSIKRGGTYLAAGADCVYPIGAADPDAVRALTAGIPGPVNVGFPGGTRDELAALGGARVNAGPQRAESRLQPSRVICSGVRRPATER